MVTSLKYPAVLTVFLYFSCDCWLEWNMMCTIRYLGTTMFYQDEQYSTNTFLVIYLSFIIMYRT